MPSYCHLHCHTQYSLLDGAADIKKMMAKAKNDGQLGVALTDHGNMFGAFHFVTEAKKQGLKPIVGCEFYLVSDRHKKQFLRSKGEEDVRYHQLLLAKNRKGYENLSKLCSLGYIEGLYGKYPRIDKKLIEQYHEGLIATSCCIGAEIPQTIIHKGEKKAEELLRWWLDIFGEDYYIELQRHSGMENIDNTGISQEDVNQMLLTFAKKYNLKVICTNDSHYVEEEDAAPHDILLCVNTNSLIQETDRFRFPSNDFYFKTQAEMNALFKDIPQSVDFTNEILDKVEPLNLVRDVLLPAFPLPDGFSSQDDYLRYLAFEGAKKRYGTIKPEIETRLNFELEVIRQSGYPGYFLIVQDFTSAARRMGVTVGPGRGSAAGSTVAYCTGITNVDPIKYDLLFERFLNPERISMPDIDIDFDDRGRDQVINYVLEKYGRNQVAQIVTYGTMAARSSLRDVGRVMNIPLSEVDRVAKTFPHLLNATLHDVLDSSETTLKEKFNSEDLERAIHFRKLAEGKDDIGEMIQSARKLEGSIRNTGIHACGVVITPDDITKYVPVTISKENDLLVSQFDNSVAESAGLLKMDFLGLKTLTIIKDAIDIIEDVWGDRIDPDNIPLEDEKTFELFQRGETIGIFQYESAGMQKHLKDLKPNTFEDLIAMNALYRPGPLQYIPNFISRKHGREAITYDLPEMEEFLADTYGISVYQEQIMLLSQKLAGFTKGQADMLRKAMGKKQKDVLDKMFDKFMEGCEKNGHPKHVCQKIWKDWESFASYAFNKSHSTCYAYLAFQTGFLKAHYPAAFMASVLSHNKDNTTDLNKFLRECKRMGIDVLGPDINESASDFTVNKKGQIRFGLSALKGVGEGPVDEILAEREKGGIFNTVFEFVCRLSSKAANKKTMESLVLGGALDLFTNIHRAQYFAPSGKYDSFIEHILRFGSEFQQRQESAAMSLFGDIGAFDIQEPEPPIVAPWPLIDLLEKEKDVTGIYISGHPLDEYRMEVDMLTTCSLEELEEKKGHGVKIAGIVTKVSHRISQKGTSYGFFTIQDYNSSFEFPLYSDDYLKFKEFFVPGNCVFITGTYEIKFNSINEYQLRVKEVTLLENAGQKHASELTLNLDLNKLDEKLLAELESIIKSHKGKHQLRLVLIDFVNRTSLNFYSHSKKVKIDNDLVSKLKSLNIGYSVN
jgi:DNA polymerase-3 subunit alpha